MVTTKASIDYETISSKTFRLAYTVTDNFMNDTGDLTINILNVNEAPKFGKKYYSFSSTENIVSVKV